MIGLASDLVHVENEYQILAKYLLGRVVVADTIDHAIALASPKLDIPCGLSRWRVSS